MKITLGSQNGMHVVQGKVVIMYSYVYGARFEEQHLMVDREDYKKNTLPPDKTKLVDIQTHY
jgi:hypothetical protein